MAKLFIVESPGKLKTLRKILGPGWLLEASVGHTTELAGDGPKRLGFEIQAETVKTHYVPRGDRGRQVLAKLKPLAAKAEMVYLATDPDREGEAIAWHLVQQLGLKRYCRIAYTQITEAAVKKALANPLDLDQSLIEAQRARQCLDKLVGYEVSPLLWNSTGGKSAGRVQSSTLHLICEREREKLKFVPEIYWILRSIYSEGLEAIYQPPGRDEKDEETARVSTIDEAIRVAEIARHEPHVVKDIEEKTESRSPPPPLITSSLQQSAGSRFRFSPNHTMKVAQELYEGIGGKGLITYMRTDAVTLSPEFIAEARDWLRENAADVLPERPPFFRAKAESQGAHEAIRPTSARLTPEEADETLSLSKDQLSLYTLIWERAMASQCKPARIARVKILIKAGETLWAARGSTLLEEGYTHFWKNIEDDKILPKVTVGETLGFKDVVTDERSTQPPPRLSEPKLVQLMEKLGIGRPSTYASTIATLKDRDYVVLESGSLAPTPLGMATDDALSRAIPELVDSHFTAQMEESLDRIADGKLGWEKYLSNWNQGYLAPALIKARELLKNVARVAAPYKPSKAGVKNLTRRKRGAAASVTGKSSTRAKGKRSRRSSPGDQAKLSRMIENAGPAPECSKGHGLLSLRTSKKGGFYWKCGSSECDSWAWFEQLSDKICPLCDAVMIKIPSKKVTGGFFLKCSKKDAHREEVVLFKNRSTMEWEKPRNS